MSNSEDNNSESPNVKVPTVKPPVNYDEFTKLEGLSEWPERITSEQLLCLADDVPEWTLENISSWLTEAAPVDMIGLDKMKEAIDGFEKGLMVYATKFLNVGEDAVPREKVDKTEAQVALLTERVYDNSDLMKSRSLKKKKAPKGHMDAMMDGLSGKSVEFCSFPGYYEGELTELPSSVEATTLLYKITKALPLKRGFLKFWKKIFLSEASVALLQDAFWWLFIDMFEKEDCSEERRKIFNRICDSFTALFFSINPEIKDEFFKYYPEAVAMTLYSSFYESFPESIKLFGSDFKQRLIDIISEWMTGGHPLPGSYNSWNLEIIESSHVPLVSSEMSGPPTKTVAENVMQAMRTLNDPREVKMDIEGFEKYVRQLSAGKSRVDIKSIASQDLKGGTMKSGSKATSSVAPVGKHRPKESHPVGAGASVSRLHFDQEAKCPLISHYFEMHGEEPRHLENVRGWLKRTELGRIASGKQTYKDFIKEHERGHKRLRREYKNTTIETDAEIKAINKRKQDINKQIQRLQKELDETWNSPLELKMRTGDILSQIDAQDSEAAAPTLDSKPKEERSSRLKPIDEQ